FGQTASRKESGSPSLFSRAFRQKRPTATTFSQFISFGIRRRENLSLLRSMATTAAGLTFPQRSQISFQSVRPTRSSWTRSPTPLFSQLRRRRQYRQETRLCKGLNECGGQP